ncbi:monothiol glutaredoxin, Grx4 family [Psittacicella melopsittaci]|uniref:Glutaredoxin n=1 Tax=Psittacicella melopsittaci TaxID=2028576 RepID=A0A3A1Y476_9GAMM|nr:Grx4 family monothiol glutaredoxin [Psittacicella melopsittaci]RIY32251.1 monothiol glutaredoxin, Grx4 family [Psittacicella melopsittaci]
MAEEVKQPTKEEVFARIERQVTENPIVIYMKGTPRFPSCGFSARAVQALINQNIDFAFVDILQNPDIRQYLPEYGDWPTFPQLWVKGELVGGCDIILELDQAGELKKILEEAVK